MYCDEVFNYWEPTHYLQTGKGLQTWEYSPVYAIRSWAYISLHAVVMGALDLLLAKDKLQLFYLMRGVLGAASAYCEAKLYRAVVEHVNPRVGRFLLVILLVSTGMFVASTAYLPSTFAMYTTTLATAFALQPPGRLRTYAVVLLVALGAVVGWPFSAAVGLPFAIENLFLSGMPLTRLRRMVEAALLSIVAIMVLVFFAFTSPVAPLVLIDRIFYEKWTFVPWNIVLYNVFSGKEKGPDIYGTEPWWFYLLNGLLNFNIVFAAALVALPALLVDVCLTRNSFRKTMLLAIKILPMYLWLGIFTLQPHKEERFLFVVYPLICLNGAIALFVGKNWLEGLLGRVNSLK
ncbi:mannosyltransferase, partial [Borealophlyctis nickersoniae]